MYADVNNPFVVKSRNDLQRKCKFNLSPPRQSCCRITLQKPSIQLCIYISEKRCVLGTMLLMNSNRKPYTIFRMVPLSMTLSDLWPRFQGHDIFEVTAGWCKTVQYCKVDQESWHDDSTFIISTHQSTWPTSSKTTTHLAPCDQLINCYCLYHGWH